jgi:hypothetical protein
MPATQAAPVAARDKREPYLFHIRFSVLTAAYTRALETLGHWKPCNKISLFAA